MCREMYIEKRKAHEIIRWQFRSAEEIGRVEHNSEVQVALAGQRRKWCCFWVVAWRNRIGEQGKKTWREAGGQQRREAWHITASDQDEGQSG